MLIDLIKDIPHAENPILDAIKASHAPVVLWGAGEVAWYVWTYLRQHDIDPTCFCDNNAKKHGTLHLGLPVYPYDHIKHIFRKTGGKYQIVLTTGIQHKEPILQQLTALREENPVWYLRGFEVCGEKITYPFFRENILAFEEAYSSLADDLSKRVFVNVLTAKISGDFNLYTQVMADREFFDDDLIALSDHEAFLDVGAYKGTSIIEFAKITKQQYDRIIALEPDKNTLAALKRIVAQHGIHNIEIHNLGAWHKRCTMRFTDGREGGSRIIESSLKDLAGTCIEVDTIDNILGGRRVTYIVMDIEGAEHAAILGAEQSIKRWRPRLGVSVYHRREDLFDLLLLIKSLVPQYNFYLRHYSDNQTETILYAL